MTNNLENKLQNDIVNLLGFEPDETIEDLDEDGFIRVPGLLNKDWTEEDAEQMPERAVDNDGYPIDGQEDDGVCR